MTRRGEESFALPDEGGMRLSGEGIWKQRE